MVEHAEISELSEAHEPPALSIVVPCYNEEEQLPHTLAALIPKLEQTMSGRWELVFVDDGSTDATLSLIADAHLRDARVKGVCLSRNFGHQNALATGLA